MKRLIYLTAIVGFIMVSCAKPNDNPNPNEGETYSFEIGAEKEADGTDGTRVEVVDGLLHWSVGDQVGMYVTNTNGTTKHIDNFAMTGIHTEPTRNTTFKGLLTQSQISQLDPNSTYRHFSYHPYGSMVLNNISNYNTYGIVMTHTLPNQITVRPNEFPMDNVYLFAEEGSLAPPMTWLDENDEQQLGARRTFTYKHTMAYLRVRINENLNGYPIEEIRVNLNTVPVSLTAMVCLSGGLSMYSNRKKDDNYYIMYANNLSASTNYKYIYVTIEDGMDVGDYIYIPIPPNVLYPYGDYGTSSRTLRFSFYYSRNGQRYQFGNKTLPVSTTEEIFFEAGKIYDIAFNL